MEREEYAIVLDYLAYGYPLENKRMPIAQAIGETGFTLLHLIPRKGVTLELKEKVYIGNGKRDKIYYIVGRLPGDKLTETAKANLSDFIAQAVVAGEKRFVEFFNKADAINTRLHQIELLPGFGKKHTNEILKERAIRPFESFNDIRERIPSLPNPVKAVEKRMLDELTLNERHRLFVQ
jgi:putative nucleotide binding protein